MRIIIPGASVSTCERSDSQSAYMNVILQRTAQLQSPQQGLCFLALFTASGVNYEERVRGLWSVFILCLSLFFFFETVD